MAYRKLATHAMPAGRARRRLENMQARATPADAPGGEAPLRVLIADDHPLMRDNLVDLIGRHPRMRVVGVATDGDDACQLAEKFLPDIVLMDLRMPGIDGLEATRRILRLRRIPIVLISAYENEHYQLAAIQAGAYALLPKSASDTEILDTLLAAAT